MKWITGVERCAECATEFHYKVPDDRPVPEICGRLACRASHDWTTEDWNGQARMANARTQACIELNDLDHEALYRTSQPRDIADWPEDTWP